MNCPEAELQLLESIDHPLAAASQAALDQHLHACQTCRDFASSQLALDRSLRAALVPPQLDTAFNARVLNRISEFPLPATAASHAERLAQAESEYEDTLHQLRDDLSQSLRRGLIAGLATATAGSAALLAALPTAPRLCQFLVSRISHPVLSPELISGCLLAVGTSGALLFILRFKPFHSPSFQLR